MGIRTYKKRNSSKKHTSRSRKQFKGGFNGTEQELSDLAALLTDIISEPSSPVDKTTFILKDGKVSDEYKRLYIKYHPDKTGSTTTEQFQLLNGLVSFLNSKGMKNVTVGDALNFNEDTFKNQSKDSEYKKISDTVMYLFAQDPDAGIMAMDMFIMMINYLTFTMLQNDKITAKEVAAMYCAITVISRIKFLFEKMQENKSAILGGRKHKTNKRQRHSKHKKQNRKTKKQKGGVIYEFLTGIVSVANSVLVKPISKVIKSVPTTLAEFHGRLVDPSEFTTKEMTAFRDLMTRYINDGITCKDAIVDVIKTSKVTNTMIEKNVIERDPNISDEDKNIQVNEGINSFAENLAKSIKEISNKGKITQEQFDYAYETACSNFNQSIRKYANDKIDDLIIKAKEFKTDDMPGIVKSKTRELKVTETSFRLDLFLTIMCIPVIISFIQYMVDSNKTPSFAGIVPDIFNAPDVAQHMSDKVWPLLVQFWPIFQSILSQSVLMIAINHMRTKLVPNSTIVELLMLAFTGLSTYTGYKTAYNQITSNGQEVPTEMDYMSFKDAPGFTAGIYDNLSTLAVNTGVGISNAFIGIINMTFMKFGVLVNSNLDQYGSEIIYTICGLMMMYSLYLVIGTASDLSRKKDEVADAVKEAYKESAFNLTKLKDEINSPEFQEFGPAGSLIKNVEKQGKNSERLFNLGATIRQEDLRRLEVEKGLTLQERQTRATERMANAAEQQQGTQQPEMLTEQQYNNPDDIT
jgi:hypothetical protein